MQSRERRENKVISTLGLRVVDFPFQSAKLAYHLASDLLCEILRGVAMLVFAHARVIRNKNHRRNDNRMPLRV